MGILNATPDSFSDGGRLAVDMGEKVARMLADGADILDVGGESTRPGHTAVPAGEEAARVLPVIREVRTRSPVIPVSIDTRKAAVARAALAAGASFVNDVSGMSDPGMAAVVREAGCAIVLMRDQPLDRTDIVGSCTAQLAALVAKARAAGIGDHAIILDPGVGFGDPPGADVAANMALVQGGSRYGQGFPVLVGASRKRFIGTMTGVQEPARRVAGSVAVAVAAVRAGAAVVRVHDVAETVDALRSESG